MSGISIIEMSGSAALDSHLNWIGGGEGLAAKGDPDNARYYQISSGRGKFGGPHPGECGGIGSGAK
jgi:hypothetical protein